LGIFRKIFQPQNGLNILINYKGLKITADSATKTIDIQPKADTERTWLWLVKDADCRMLPLTETGNTTARGLTSQSS
jgi:hypothetical protein